MRTICLYFQIHQPFRLKRYRFFNIGNDHYYYDDYLNESIISRVAERSFLQANKVIGQIIKEYGTQFKVAFSISALHSTNSNCMHLKSLLVFRNSLKPVRLSFLPKPIPIHWLPLKTRMSFSDR